jgi:hypothetical protein
MAPVREVVNVKNKIIWRPTWSQLGIRHSGRPAQDYLRLCADFAGNPLTASDEARFFCCRDLRPLTDWSRDRGQGVPLPVIDA